MTQTNEFTFVPATKTQRKARVALIGQAGSGKTMSGLLMAKGFTAGDPPRIAVIDTEHGSASLYSDLVKFDVLRLTPPYSPTRYRAACEAAVKAGYHVLLIDSMSQEWNGEGGILEAVDARKQRGNEFTAWNGPSQEHEAFIQFVVGLPVHVIATFRSKMAYTMQTENGRTKVEKVGLEAITRGNAEYETDLVLEMTQDHRAVVTKSRIPMFADRTIVKPGEREGRELFAWLTSGAVEAQPEAVTEGATKSIPPLSGGNIVPVSELKARAERETNGNGKTGYIETAPVLGDKVARDALITECVHIWGKSIADAKAFVKQRDLPSALTKWSTEDLVAFKEHMTAVALAKA